MFAKIPRTEMYEGPNHPGPVFLCQDRIYHCYTPQVPGWTFSDPLGMRWGCVVELLSQKNNFSCCPLASDNVGDQWSVIDQQWSVQWSQPGQALLCGRAFTVGDGHVKPFNICKKCSPTVFLMLMPELSLVPLKQSSIGWLISPYINLFHSINPLFFSDPSVGERWVRNKSIYHVLHWKQTPCTWKLQQSTYTDTFFCMVFVIIAVWCQNKRSHRTFLSAKNFPRKRLLSRLSVLKILMENQATKDAKLTKSWPSWSERESWDQNLAWSFKEVPHWNTLWAFRDMKLQFYWNTSCQVFQLYE